MKIYKNCYDWTLLQNLVNTLSKILYVLSYLFWQVGGNLGECLLLAEGWISFAPMSWHPIKPIHKIVAYWSFLSLWLRKRGTSVLLAIWDIHLSSKYTCQKRLGYEQKDSVSGSIWDHDSNIRGKIEIQPYSCIMKSHNNHMEASHILLLFE